jgi:hypothetical protein
MKAYMKSEMPKSKKEVSEQRAEGDPVLANMPRKEHYQTLAADTKSYQYLESCSQVH